MSGIFIQTSTMWRCVVNLLYSTMMFVETCQALSFLSAPGLRRYVRRVLNPLTMLRAVPSCGATASKKTFRAMLELLLFALFPWHILLNMWNSVGQSWEESGEKRDILLWQTLLTFSKMFISALGWKPAIQLWIIASWKRVWVES